jgi:hypothetical protein
MAGFFFRLELERGTHAGPPVLHAAVPNWIAGDAIPLGAERTLRVVETQARDTARGVSARALEAEAAERAFDLRHACSDSVEVLT